MTLIFTISRILFVLSVFSRCQGKNYTENKIEKMVITTEREKNCDSGGKYRKTEETKECMKNSFKCTEPMLTMLEVGDKNGTFCTAKECDLFYTQELRKSSNLDNKIYPVCRKEADSADCTNVFVDKADLYKSGNQIIAECKQKHQEACKSRFKAIHKSNFYKKCFSHYCETKQHLISPNYAQYNSVVCSDQSIIDEAFAAYEMPDSKRSSGGCFYDVAMKNNDIPFFYEPICPVGYKMIDALYSHVTHYYGVSSSYTPRTYNLCKTQTVCEK